ncbi:MAG: aminotransferase class V-fold PLP-dependent enzyme, partial [Agathobaculum sp.]|nr:aminotransferase class V-fold PLP-dependent enzyme [Agathobaculum sp.]
AEQAAAQLADAGIAVRAGLHCAPIAHRTAGTEETGTVRLSLSFYSTPGQAEQAAEAFKLVKKL